MITIQSIRALQNKGWVVVEGPQSGTGHNSPHRQIVATKVGTEQQIWTYFDVKNLGGSVDYVVASAAKDFEPNTTHLSLRGALNQIERNLAQVDA